MAVSAHDPGTKIKVLLVDDDEAERAELARWLQRAAGFDVDTAPDGELALQRVRQARGDYDVAVIDQVLHGIDGIETMKFLKADYPDLEVVIFTALNRGSGVEALRQGAYRYLLQPFDPEEMAMAVRDAVRLRALRSRAVEMEWLPAVLRAVQELSALPLTVMLGETVEEVNRRIAEKVVQAVHSLTQDDVAFWLPDETGVQWKIWGHVGLDAAYVETARFSLEDSVSGAALKAGEIAEVDDIFDPGRKPRFKYQEQALKAGWKSELIVPLRAQGHVLGTISVYSKVQRSFPEWEKNLLSTIGNQAAVSLVQSQLRGKETVLREVGRSLVASVPLQLERILPAIVQGALKLTGTESGVVHVIDETGTRIVASHGYPEVFERPQRMREEGNTCWIVKNKKRVIHDSVHTAPCSINPAVLVRDVKAFVGEPLILENRRVVGVLYVNDKSPRQFNESEFQLLESLGNQAAIAIENARLLEELDERAARLEQLHRIATSVSATAIGLEEVSRLIVESLSNQVFPGASCAIRLYDAKTDEFTLAKATGRLKDLIEDRPRPDGTSRYVVRERTPLYIEDTWGFPPAGMPCVRQEFLDRGVKAIAYIPLIGEGGVVTGILYVNLFSPYRFSQNDRLILELFAHQATIAIENARLYKRISRQLDALRRIIGTIGAETDPLPTILEEAITLFGAQYGSFTMVDRAAGQLTTRVIWEKGQKLTGLQISEGRRVWNWDKGIVGYVAQESRVHHTGDVSSDPYYLLWYSDVLSEMAVPLTGKDGKAVGVLNLESVSRDAFSQTDVGFCQDLANVAASVIDKDVMFDTMHQLNIQLESLHRVVQEQEPDKAAEQTLFSINAILGEGTSSSIHLLEPSAGSRQYWAAGPLKEYLLGVPPRQSLNGKLVGTTEYVLRQKRPLYLDDVLNPPPECPTIRRESIERGVRSFAALPLRWQDRIVGLLYINPQKQLSFSPEIRRVLELFASQAAVAIENARLFRELDERASQLKRLQDAAFAVSASPLNLDEVLNVVIESLSAMFEGASCDMRLYDADKDNFGKRVVSQRMKDREDRPPRQDGSSRYVVRKRVARYIEDTLQAPRDDGPEIHPAILAEGARALAHLPLLSGNDVVGVLYLNLPTPHQFSSNEKDMLKLFASQAVIAIDRAKQFDQLQAMNAQLQAMNAQLQAMNAQLQAMNAQLQAINQLGDNLAALE